jgi:tetratricopeptide (TPR) repeat protein
VAEAFGSVGKILLATEYTTEAETAFRNAQMLAPSDMRWPYYLGHVYRLRQEPARAIPMFERALALAPEDVPSLIWLSELHLTSGNAAAADPYLRRALAEQPDSSAAVARLGRVALAARDYPTAIEHLEHALRLTPDATSVHYALGMAYRGAGQIDKAETHLRQGSDAGGLAPADPLMDQVSGLLQNASTYEARGMQALDARNWNAAVENLRQAAALSPENAVIRLNLGTALSLAGDGAAASRELLEAVRLAPELAKAHFGLGLLAQDDGRWEEAIDRFSTAVRHQPDFVDAHYALAEALRRTGRAEAAVAHYRDVLRLNAAASQARFGHAMALVRLRRFADARSTLAEAVQMHPEQPGFSHALARLLAAAPDPQVRDGQRALMLMEPLAAQPGAAVAETMGMVSAELGRFDQAVEWQQRAIATAREGGQSDLAARMQDNLDLYRRRQPCRTPWREDDPVIAVVSRAPR